MICIVHQPLGTAVLVSVPGTETRSVSAGQGGRLPPGASVSEPSLITCSCNNQEEALKMGNYVSLLLQNSPGPGAKENSSQERPAREQAAGAPVEGACS